ncbi:PRC and DUF2382 domain-containing protein [Arthrobacter mangrovi]|uniref:Photosystem reaction center subunit H n=1 Tax=Arthrobacter mangrovi TaxID=2966350 RepID=A0ABQ5MZK4_9MICC|nr:PRC and DUF2382 domain-containing protein [Arthrobacter mangrovi]GLB69393.1 photosystem reaction center subunit H [Arthrobacter mangrovi]
MITRENIDILAGGNTNVLDNSGNKIGSVGQFYLDDRTEDPSWVTVKTGLFGMSETFVPLTEATYDDGDIRVPYTKDEVKDAPRIDPDGHLSPEEEDHLYRHYSIANGNGTRGTNGNGTRDTSATDTLAGTADAGTRGVADRETTGHGLADRDRLADRDVAGRGTDDAMTRSEEQLHVGTERHETGRARLRKYVVTENVTRTVPVTREEVRVEREPITDGNVGDAMSGPDLREDEHEVTLHEERPVVDKETVPVERVRLEKDTVTDQETVSDEVRKERIEADGADDRLRDGTLDRDRDR